MTRRSAGNREFIRVLEHTDIFFPNDAEALCITGCKTVKAAAQELGKASPNRLRKVWRARGTDPCRRRIFPHASY